MPSQIVSGVPYSSSYTLGYIDQLHTSCSVISLRIDFNDQPCMQLTHKLVDYQFSSPLLLMV